MCDCKKKSSKDIQKRIIKLKEKIKNLEKQLLKKEDNWDGYFKD